MQQKYTAIIDQIGRSIIGKVVSETDTTLTINNPVILHLEQVQGGSLSVNSFPLFFFEFINKDNRQNNDWTYTKASIVTSNVVLDDRVITGYEQINNPINAVQPQPTNPKIIKIEDID